uniref:Uncharacterized protein LOC105641803 isoform X2 n=1 Tax=Rhizophora mucronata TaxID=61149 RepID=A0A2P2JI11_RHIMU
MAILVMHFQQAEQILLLDKETGVMQCQQNELISQKKHY